MEEEKRDKSKRKNTPFRLNILFLMTFFAFSTLVIRIGIVQVVNGKAYSRKLQQSQTVTDKIQTPRGLIFDRNGVLLAGNKATYTVMFTRNQSMTESDLIKIAKKLTQYLTVSTAKTVQSGKLSTSQVTQRDLKDFWISTHFNAYQEKLTPKEQKESSQQAYQLLLSRITQKDLESISPSELKVVAIWRELNQATDLSPTQIDSNLTPGELAKLGEHLSEFNGAISTSISANRIYPKGNLFFLGGVGSIPQNEINRYRAEGLSPNDLVGTSFLEQEYNNELSGFPKTETFQTNSGVPVGQPKVTQGRRGDDLVLTIDFNLEQQVNQIIKQQIKSCYPTDHQCNQAYAVVMNPNTGGILAIAGQLYNGHQFQDAAAGAVFNSFAMGSAVKGATELAGYQNHAVPGILKDKNINYAGGGTFHSDVNTIGTINAAQALEYSSNVYMGTIAARMAGFKIKDQGSNYLMQTNSGPHFVKAFETLRNDYGEFGLGVKTGVDLPYEGTGYQGPIPISQPGKIMQFAIGQYDTYTPLEMAQYVSTIANGGYRIAPHFLKSINTLGNQPNQIGPTLYQMQPKVLDKVPNSPSQFQTVHKGFYLVTHGGPGATASMIGALWPQYSIAAKTGTAQVGQNYKLVNNKTLVGFAPYKNPQVAVCVVVPHIQAEPANLWIGGDIFQAYFKDQGK